MLSYCCNCSLAHSSKKQYGDAKVCFERALEMDPTNDSYKTNLEFANQKLEESVSFPNNTLNPNFPEISYFSLCFTESNARWFSNDAGFSGNGK